MKAHREDYAIRSLGLVRLLILAFGGLLAAIIILTGGQPYGAPMDATDIWNCTLQFVVLLTVLGLTYSPKWGRIHHLVGSVSVTLLAIGTLLPYRNAAEAFYETQFVATSSIAIFAIFGMVRLPWTWAAGAASVVVAFSAYFVAVLRPLPDGAQPWISWAFAFLLGFVVCRKGAQTDQQLFVARQAVDELLDSVYPKPVADRLRRGERVIADEIDEAAIMMLDIVNFSGFASGRPAAEVVRDLNDLYGLFDSLAEIHAVTKIKTSGDLYMAVATGDDAASRMAGYALSLVEQTAGRWSFRIGLHIGGVAAGVVGETRSLYDVWGDAVNLAARMEQTGEPGRVQVSPQFADRLATTFGLEARGEIEVKGQGKMCPCWLTPGASEGSAASK